VFALGYAYRGVSQRVNMLPDKYPQGHITMIPNGETKFGEQILPYWLRKIQPDVLITLADLWMTGYIHKIKMGHTRWVRLIPLDSHTMLPSWAQQIQHTDIPVTFAKFANKLVKDTCGIEVKNIPHGIDTNIFTPLSKEKKEKGRANAGVNEKDFVIGFVSRNQIRKMQPYFFKAFAKFAKNKQDVKALIHMDLVDERLGWNLRNIFHLLNIQSKVIKSTQTEGFAFKFDIDDNKMNVLYNLMNVHYHPGSEGFGLCPMEANGAGTPNIGVDYTTAPESLNYGKCGWLSKIGMLWTHPVGAEWAIPDVNDLAKWMQYTYENREEVKEIGERARRYAVSNYSWDVIGPEWIKFVDEIINNPPEPNYKTGEVGV